MLLHMLPYISSQFRMVLGYLQRVSTRYREIYKKTYTNIFLKKNDGNPLQIAQNQANLRENIW